MEEEGGLSFDFEGGLDVAPTNPTASVPVIQQDSYAANAAAAANTNAVTIVTSGTNDSAAGGNVSSRRSFRQTVCRHWLRSLCMKGDACGFLHQFDKARMPICRFFRLYGECREQDCVYKHTNEDIKECNMYKLGFCPNGPDCRYRHAKLPGPPPPVEEVLQKIQNLNSFYYGNTNRFFQHRNANYPQQMEKPQFQQGLNTANQGVPVRPLTTEFADTQQQQIPQAQQQVGQIQVPTPSIGLPNQMSRAATPLPQGVSRYFIVKSCNRENLELSVQQGVWATQRSNEAKLNEAFDTVDNVILMFSVNRTRHFQGCAKMTSKIGGYVGGGNWKYAHGTAHYGRNFSVKWLKLCELSFHNTRHLRNPYNENLPVKISRDCQELEPSVGEQLASLLYVEPDSELMAVAIAAELKRDEEKAKGVNPENEIGNPDIVPFEDNEEEEEDDEEEEESDEEDEGLATGMQGRGRGGGVMWLPNMPLAHGPRPLPPGMRGFPPVMMGPDGFSYGADVFGVGPRAFPPYGPRFPGNMMFHGRPPQPGNVFPPGGFGMMMGPGRPPFMGPMGVGPNGPPRGGRPIGMSAMLPPPPSLPAQNVIQGGKRDQRELSNDHNSRNSTGAGRTNGKDNETHHQNGSSGQHDDHLGGGNNFQKEDSDSEDEAPRRSRHGEGRKKRRDAEGDASMDA